MSPQNETRASAEDSFRLGEWLVEPRLNRLSRESESFQIELKMMDVLVCLAERAGDLVERRQLIDTVWATEYITEKTLTRAVAELRRTLGDDAKEPTYIETIHRKGYRLIAPVEAIEKPTATVTPFPTPTVARDDRSPYPGLAAFTEEDAEFFFGREAEVAELWRKITTRRLLAVIGPSGVGKSSFLRAGVMASAPEGWSTCIITPGESPLTSLARGMVAEFRGDVEAIESLVDLRDSDRAVAIVSRWRDRHDRALLIVDQFEELFTLNPEPVQAEFATLLRRLVDATGIHVLLAMRDDFLYRCQAYPPLRPVLEDLTALQQPHSESLHRALVEPARKLGFAFEDGLASEMVAEVEDERGALPMLAFAVARLWDRRDSARRLLTRRAYEEIGGVAGALARHAEATIDHVGADRIPIVREIFRNLVTAEGTRAVREWTELLSVFDSADVKREGINPSPTNARKGVGAGFNPARADAENVLHKLIDARLLTSYEVSEGDQEPTRHVEVVHESLLTNWPRLVRWQTQDADAVQLRDQLRQAARTWDEHDRTDDMLWTGSVFREFAVWHERYPGGLSELEQAFASAMTALATRRKRRRRIAATAAIVLALAIAAVFGTLWRRSVLETRRAEAQKLLALAQVQIEKDPTEALAYAAASLELSDTHEARIFALRSLWAGPPVRVLDPRIADPVGQFAVPIFSPDGRWLAVAGLVNEDVLVFGEAGNRPIVLGGHAVSAAGPIQCAWTRDNLLVTGHQSEKRARVWSMPGGGLVATIDFEGPAWWQVRHEHLFAELGQQTPPASGEAWPLRLVRCRLPDGQAEDLGTVDIRAVGAYHSIFDPRGNAWLYSKGNGVYARPVPIVAGAPDTLLGRHSADRVTFGTWGTASDFFSADSSGEIILWAVNGESWAPRRRVRPPEGVSDSLVPDPSGRWVTRGGVLGTSIPVWDLEAPRDADPLQLRRNKFYFSCAFHPHSDWLAATESDTGETSLWPLVGPFPAVIEGWCFSGFTRDGRYLVATDWGANHPSTRVRLWPVPGNGLDDVVDLMLPPGSGGVGHMVSVDPAGLRALAVNYGSSSFLLSANGAPPRNLFGFPASDRVTAGGFSPSGQLVAAASQQSEGQATLRIWDLRTDKVRVFGQPTDPEAHGGYSTYSLAFVDETTLYTDGANGLLRWDVEAGTFDVVERAPSGGELWMSTAADLQTMLTYEIGSTWARLSGTTKLRDLKTGRVRSLEIPGSGPLQLSPDGSIWVSGEPDGSIQVGRIDSNIVHMLLGGEFQVGFPAVSPDNRWVTSSDLRSTRLWPMPDLSKPPLHTLPHEELIAKLKSLTNLRAVRDEDFSTGWTIEVGPFPGWAAVPTW